MFEVRMRRDTVFAGEVRAAREAELFAAEHLAEARQCPNPDETIRFATDLVSIDGTVVDVGVTTRQDARPHRRVPARSRGLRLRDEFGVARGLAPGLPSRVVQAGRAARVARCDDRRRPVRRDVAEVRRRALRADRAAARRHEHLQLDRPGARDPRRAHRHRHGHRPGRVLQLPGLAGPRVQGVGSSTSSGPVCASATRATPSTTNRSSSRSSVDHAPARTDLSHRGEYLRIVGGKSKGRSEGGYRGRRVSLPGPVGTKFRTG